jgi:hypothetical protein
MEARNYRVFRKNVYIKKMAQNHERRLHNHPNTEAIQLLNYREATRRLNSTKPLELCSACSDPS